jgi:NAD(P)-dependent dehydrogenase (short-subunit alcohol dehydrogenase family)
MSEIKSKNNLDVPIALITGSSRGIGRSIAFNLSELGYHVVINSRNEDELNKTKLEIQGKAKKCSTFMGDLTDPKQIELCAEFIKNNFGRLDLLVTNIGSGRTENNLITDLAEWKRIFDINFFSAVCAINSFLPLIEKNQGHICCISSIAGIEKIDIPISYSVAKAALVSLVKQMMRPLAEKQVRINSVSPGMTFFENGSWDRKLKQDPLRVNELVRTQVALKKFVTPEDVADCVRFLEVNKSMTGQNIIVDAGHTRQT